MFDNACEMILSKLPDKILRELKNAKARAGPLAWKNAIGEGRDRGEEKSISQMKRAGEVHLIVAALIATVTFAAGFTLPGGYNDDDGKAILTKKAALKAFIVTDTIAMVLSPYLLYWFIFFWHRMRKGIWSQSIYSGALYSPLLPWEQWWLHS